MGLGDVEERDEKVGHVVGGQRGAQSTDKSGRGRGPSGRNLGHNEFTVNTGFITQAASSLILTDNPNRTYLLIQNNSAGIMYVSFTGKANVFSGVQIAAGGYYEPYRTPKSSISVFGVAGLSGVVIESIKVS